MTSLSAITAKPIAAIFCFTIAAALTGCGGVPGTINLSGGCITTIAISPAISSMAPGTSTTFTATVSPLNTATVTWKLDTGYGNPPGGVGTLTPSSGPSTVYTAPAAPPIYPDPTATQGAALLEAGLQGGTCFVSGGTLYIPISAPQVTAGVSPATASVALGTSLNLYGYAVGNANANITWQVNGALNGSSSVGTIARSGNTILSTGPETQVFYTAPAAMPVTGPNITITVISQIDPTKTATAAITLH